MRDAARDGSARVTRYALESQNQKWETVKNEFEADAYAAQQAPAQELIKALIKLYKDNSSTLTPDKLYSAFYDSHPPASARISRLEASIN